MNSRIIELCSDLGIDTIGFFEGGISIAFAYNFFDTTDNGFSTYTKRADYHYIVRIYLDKICSYIQSLGFMAEAFVDSNPLPERYLASKCGVGFIGKNGMLITKKYGSYVFLSEILTNMPLKLTMPNKNSCGNCNLCIQACPVNAIYDKTKCLSLITQKKHINIEEVNSLCGNIFGCDICQIVCPHNKNAMPSQIDEFKTLSFMEQDAFIYASMDNSFFKEYIKKTSCGFKGKNIIIRNALIALSKRGDEIRQFKGNSEYINFYIKLLRGD
ncbi:MAG: hypothetical protein BEN19_03490 [Epulopiscium sp. Nuni2H_MBin003]|nr:MAG: hypothetical protein BEN19_03490 [Epulopiscium sp. Nuni2H_MBin003]